MEETTTPDGRRDARLDPQSPRDAEEAMLREAEDGSPVRPGDHPARKDGDASARGLQTGAEGDLTTPGNQAEERRD